MRAAPSDIIVFGDASLSFVRLRRSKKGFEAVQARRYRLDDLFTAAAVTPQLEDTAALTEILRRLRSDAGSVDKVAILLPDSWFRLNLLELNDLPDPRAEAEEVIRWSLKRTLPIPPELLRLSFLVLHRMENRRRLLVVSALEKTLAGIERSCREAGLDPVIIEPLGLNVWNAIAAAEPATAGERLLIHVSENEFTTALFRGDEPIFLRSRQLHGDRSVAQEIRLSASYLRDNLPVRLERCYIFGSAADETVTSVVREQFGTEVRRVSAAQFVQFAPGLDAAVLESEVMASAGVFAA